MTAIVFRLALLAIGLSLGQIGLDSFARGADVAVAQFALAVAALVAGSASFIGPLLAGGLREEAHHA